MKTAAIISEYNPFHNGHKYHIEETKKICEASHIIAVMSGNFTQRGDAAIFDKWERTKSALNNGVDLVIELPVAAALGSAEYFSLGAISIINALGCVDFLSFGSESGDIELLKEVAGAVHYCSEQDSFYGLMRRGFSYPVALRQTMLEYYDDEVALTLDSPNNTLAIEYLKAMNQTGSFIKPVTVKRYGASHDSVNENFDSIVSASQLRGMIVENREISKLMPGVVFSDYSLLARLEIAILSKIRTMTVSEILKVPNVLQGLENRIFKAARIARTLPELLALIKTKRYTMARLRRIILCCYLGITKSDTETLPQYVRVLGMNDKGKDILAKAVCDLPINTSLKALSKTSLQARKQANLEERAGNLYALSFSKPLPCGLDYTHKPIIL